MKVNIWNVLILIIVSIFSMVGGVLFLGVHNHIVYPILYRTFGDKTIFTEIVKEENITTPIHISEYFQKNYRYQSDEVIHNKEEYWQTPLETVTLKVGDCEDFAFLAQEFLNQIGIKSKVYSFNSVINEKDYGHAICIFLWKYNYYIFDNQYVYESKYYTIESILQNEYAVERSWCEVY